MQKTIYQPNQINSPLLRHRFNVTSQRGEDGIIQHITDILNPSNKYCVEFGAWDGKHFSNCYNLLVNKNWHGVMIEANFNKYQELIETYKAHTNVKTINRLVDFDGPNTLDNILSECGAPTAISVLSIDIDGNDFYIWESLNEYAPELIVIEFNPSIPNDVLFVQDKSFEINQGCSLLALIALGKSKGYELAVCTEWNAFFVKREKLQALGVTDNAINSLYNPLQNGRIFQGYDGTIHVVGMDKLLWRNEPLNSEDFQVLPKEQRVWADAQK